MSTTPHQFISRGNLFITPVVQAPQVSYPAQPFAKPRDFSLWVHGAIEEPAFQLDRARMPPSLYQEVRADLMTFSPVEVTRSSFRRSQHAYVGVIDSKGTPYYFALDGRGISIREAEVNDDRVWKTFDQLADEERGMATRKRRGESDAEMAQVARELSAPQLVILKSDFDWKRKTKERVGDKKMAQRSLKEEKTAVSEYKKRKERTSDPELKDVFEHTGKEEKQHARMLKPFAKARSKSGGDLHWKNSSAKAHHGTYTVNPDSEGHALWYRANGAEQPTITNHATHEDAVEAALHHHAKQSAMKGFPTKKDDGTPIKKPSLYQKLRGLAGKPRTDITDTGDDAPVVPKMKVLTKALAFHRATGGQYSEETPHGSYEVHSKKKLLGVGKKHVLMYYPWDKNKPHQVKLSTHSTIADAHAAADSHHQKQITTKALYIIVKALPKKPKEEKVKKTPNKGASKKQAGAGGKTRYTYPNEKKGGAKNPGGKPMQQQPLLVVRHDDSKNANPAELANQLGVSMRTLQRCAKKLGRDGFSKFMRSHLKRFSAKHRLDPDYWGTLYEKLMPGVG